MSLKVTQEAIDAMKGLAQALAQQHRELEKGAQQLASILDENAHGLGYHSQSLGTLIKELETATRGVQVVKKLARRLKMSADIRQGHITGNIYSTTDFKGGEMNRLSAGGSRKILTDGSHMKDGKPLPCVTYTAGEHKYLYKTDHKGRVCEVYAESLQFKTHDGRLPHNSKTFDKLLDDEAGHLIADLFGGSPKLDNLVSQAKEVNRKKFRKKECEWAKALTDGHRVEVAISSEYGENSRPVFFTIHETIYRKSGRRRPCSASVKIDNLNIDDS